MKTSNNGMENFSESDSCDANTVAFANKLLLKTPIYYLVNQVEILQTLGNYTVAAYLESDELFLKNGLLKKSNSTKIIRLPGQWKKMFKCFSFGSNDYQYMDERLVIPKPSRRTRDTPDAIACLSQYPTFGVRAFTER